MGETMEMSKILIIDDETQIRQLIINHLTETKNNYMFYQAKDGESGIEVAKKFQPDLIISDWMMPGISGIETVKRLKRDYTTLNIPVIMVSGVMIDMESLKEAFGAGAIDFIRKPIDPVELIARTRSMLILAKSFKEQLASQNRELNTLRTSILHKSRLFVELSSKMIKILDKHDEVEMKGKIETLTKKALKENQNNIWRDYESHFNMIYPGFFERLAHKFNNLTTTEMKVCAFVRMKLSTKEISEILFVEPNTVRINRNRIRKKLNMERDDNLTSFLNNI